MRYLPGRKTRGVVVSHGGLGQKREPGASGRRPDVFVFQYNAVLGPSPPNMNASSQHHVPPVSRGHGDGHDCNGSGCPGQFRGETKQATASEGWRMEALVRAEPRWFSSRPSAEYAPSVFLSDQRRLVAAPASWELTRPKPTRTPLDPARLLLTGRIVGEGGLVTPDAAPRDYEPTPGRVDWIPTG